MEDHNMESSTIEKFSNSIENYFKPIIIEEPPEGKDTIKFAAAYLRERKYIHKALSLSRYSVSILYQLMDKILVKVYKLRTNLKRNQDLFNSGITFVRNALVMQVSPNVKFSKFLLYIDKKKFTEMKIKLLEWIFNVDKVIYFLAASSSKEDDRIKSLIEYENLFLNLAFTFFKATKKDEFGNFLDRLIVPKILNIEKCIGNRNIRKGLTGLLSRILLANHYSKELREIYYNTVIEKLFVLFCQRDSNQIQNSNSTRFKLDSNTFYTQLFTKLIKRIYTHNKAIIENEFSKEPKILKNLILEYQNISIKFKNEINNRDKRLEDALQIIEKKYRNQFQKSYFLPIYPIRAISYLLNKKYSNQFKEYLCFDGIKKFLSLSIPLWGKEGFSIIKIYLETYMCFSFQIIKRKDTQSIEPVIRDILYHLSVIEDKSLLKRFLYSLTYSFKRFKNKTTYQYLYQILFEKKFKLSKKVQTILFLLDDFLFGNKKNKINYMNTIFQLQKDEYFSIFYKMIKCYTTSDIHLRKLIVLIAFKIFNSKNEDLKAVEATLRGEYTLRNNLISLSIEYIRYFNSSHDSYLVNKAFKVLLQFTINDYTKYYLKVAKRTEDRVMPVDLCQLYEFDKLKEWFKITINKFFDFEMDQIESRMYYFGYFNNENQIDFFRLFKDLKIFPITGCLSEKTQTFQYILTIFETIKKSLKEFKFAELFLSFFNIGKYISVELTIKTIILMITKSIEAGIIPQMIQLFKALSRINNFQIARIIIETVTYCSILLETSWNKFVDEYCQSKKKKKEELEILVLQNREKLFQDENHAKSLMIEGINECEQKLQRDFKFMKNLNSFLLGTRILNLEEVSFKYGLFCETIKFLDPKNRQQSEVSRASEFESIEINEKSKMNLVLHRICIFPIDCIQYFANENVKFLNNILFKLNKEKFISEDKLFPTNFFRYLKNSFLRKALYANIRDLVENPFSSFLLYFRVIDPFIEEVFGYLITLFSLYLKFEKNSSKIGSYQRIFRSSSEIHDLFLKVNEVLANDLKILISYNGVDRLYRFIFYQQIRIFIYKFFLISKEISESKSSKKKISQRYSCEEKLDELFKKIIHYSKTLKKNTQMKAYFFHIIGSFTKSSHKKIYYAFCCGSLQEIYRKFQKTNPDNQYFSDIMDRLLIICSKKHKDIVFNSDYISLCQKFGREDPWKTLNFVNIPKINYSNAGIDFLIKNDMGSIVEKMKIKIITKFCKKNLAQIKVQNIEKEKKHIPFDNLKEVIAIEKKIKNEYQNNNNNLGNLGNLNILPSKIYYQIYLFYKTFLKEDYFNKMKYLALSGKDNPNLFWEVILKAIKMMSKEENKMSKDQFNSVMMIFNEYDEHRMACLVRLLSNLLDKAFLPNAQELIFGLISKHISKYFSQNIYWIYELLSEFDNKCSNKANSLKDLLNEIKIKKNKIRVFIQNILSMSENKIDLGDPIFKPINCLKNICLITDKTNLHKQIDEFNKQLLQCIKLNRFLIVPYRKYTLPLFFLKNKLPNQSNPYYENPPYISEILPDDISILASKAKPKLVELTGTNKIKYKIILKGNPNLSEYMEFFGLRKEKFCIEFMRICEQCFEGSDTFTKSILKLIPYSINPFSERSGCIEFVPKTVGLKAKVVELIGESNYNRKTKEINEEKKARKGKITKEPHDPMLHLYFDNNFPDPSKWLASKLNFTSSTAVYSLFGFFVGLGDRHPENILLKYEEGRVIHIDLELILGEGLKLQVPETVPFRLTNSIRDVILMGENQELFYSICLKMVTLMKKNLNLIKKLIGISDIYLIQKMEEKGSLITERERNINTNSFRGNQENIQLNHYPYLYQGIGKYFLRFLKLLESNQNTIANTLKDIVSQASDQNLLKNMYIGWNYAL